MRAFVFRLASGVTLGLLSLAALAQPTINGDFVFTENRGATSLFAAGHSFIIGATNITPSGSGTAVTATHVPAGSGPDYAISFVPFPVFPNQYAVRAPYAGQTGQWDIAATNAAGTTVKRTHTLDDIRILPLIADLTATGPALAPHLSWDAVSFAAFPSFCSAPPAGGGSWGECAVGYDFFNYQVEVREITGTPGVSPIIFTSANMNTSTPDMTPLPTEFDLPLGLLEAGHSYLIGLRLNHFELEQITQPFPDARFFSPLENRSIAYLEFTTAIPEPETYALLVAGLGLLGFVARRRQTLPAA
ncbi:MAG TPA: PEP-CTERM sorting domain-containing protein [Burkholderiales bacterium]|nr:PEP-CTERM sorting domain-containing protein [Burkholderiales bacterium]